MDARRMFVCVMCAASAALAIAVALHGQVSEPAQDMGEISDVPPRDLAELLARLRSDAQKADSELVGTIVAYAGQRPPDGWLVCDGTETPVRLSRLAGVLGETYGKGKEGRPLLPHLQGRFPLGAGASPELTARPVGLKGGHESVALTLDQMPEHNHEFDDPGHKHKSLFGKASHGGANTEFAARWDTGDNAAHTSQPATTNIVFKAQGKGHPHENMPPFLAVNFIIKAE